MIPLAVTTFLKKGAAGEIADTPKADNPIFQQVQNLLIGNNQLALVAAKEKAQALGYNTLILSSSVEGEAARVAIDHVVSARDVLSSSSPVRPPACIICGGETTVTIRGAGLGGRNQEFALAAALEIRGLPNVLVFSAGTDGTDGPTDAAGAMADGETVERGPDALRFLDENDSYHYFQP